MSWADRLLPASLGGVAFLALSSRVSVGRRVTVIELPGRDAPEHEDMGRRARRCSLTAVMLGENYDRDRQALADVLETKGPHKFSHPWWGESLVIIEDAGEFEESADRGGIVSVSLTLTEGGVSAAVVATVVPAAAMAAALAAAGDAAVADFAEEYSVGLGDSFDQATAAISSVNDQLDAVNNKIAAALGLGDGVVAALDELKDQATALISTPTALGATLNTLLSSVTSLLGLTDGVTATYPGQVAKLATETALAAAQQLGAIDVTAQPPYPGGPIHPATRASTGAITKLVRASSLIGVTGLFRTLPLESAGAAAQVLDTLGSLTEQLLADPTTSDALTAALTDLRAALQQQLGIVAGALPTTTQFTPVASTPALLLAWQLHGDPTRDLEIVARNGLLDPNFVPGGQPLEILGA